MDPLGLTTKTVAQDEVRAFASRPRPEESREAAHSELKRDLVRLKRILRL
jgi:hypothetical protein